MKSVFEKIIDREIPADILYEDDTVMVCLDINPIRKGHSLVVPKKKFENVFDGDPDTLGYMMKVAQKIAKGIMSATGAKGVNIHMNNGHAAGQDVPHAHLHVIPRFERGEAFAHPVHETYDNRESRSLAEKIRSALG